MRQCVYLYAMCVRVYVLYVCVCVCASVCVYVHVVVCKCLYVWMGVLVRMRVCTWFMHQRASKFLSLCLSRPFPQLREGRVEGIRNPLKMCSWPWLAKVEPEIQAPEINV